MGYMSIRFEYRETIKNNNNDLFLWYKSIVFGLTEMTY